MKLSAIKGLMAFSLGMLLLFGSVAYSFAVSVHKTEIVKHVTLDVYADDAIVIEIPIKKAGFQTLLMMLYSENRKKIIPVAHAPPGSVHT